MPPPLQPLGQFEKAEEYLKKSLDIRVNSLKRDHFLVANTYRQLSDLYLEWAKHAAFAAKARERRHSSFTRASIRYGSFLVGNTYRQLLDLDLEWAKHAAFAAIRIGGWQLLLAV